MPLPGAPAVADEFKALPQEAKQSIAQRIQQKQQESVNQRKPDVPDWLKFAQPQTPITQQGREAGSRVTDQLSQVGNMGQSANQATNEALNYRRQQQFLKEQAEMRARMERQGEFIGNLGSGWDAPINASGKRGAVINAARRLLGVQYSWGGGHGGTPGPSYGIAQGRNIKGVDCSGLVRYAFAKAGIKGWGKSAVASTQSMYGRAASIGSLLPGDLVVKGGRGRAHHIAIYIGGGRILEAQQTGTRVHIRSIKGQSGWTGIHLNY